MTDKLLPLPEVWGSLSRDVLVHLLARIDLPSLAHLAQTCAAFAAVADLHELWVQRLFLDFKLGPFGA